VACFAQLKQPVRHFGVSEIPNGLEAARKEQTANSKLQMFAADGNQFVSPRSGNCGYRRGMDPREGVWTRVLFWTAGGRCRGVSLECQTKCHSAINYTSQSPSLNRSSTCTWGSGALKYLWQVQSHQEQSSVAG